MREASRSRASITTCCVSRCSLDAGHEGSEGAERRALQVQVRRARGSAGCQGNFGTRRKRLDGTLSKDKRYINVYGGPRASANLGWMARELEERGLGGFISIVEGPLLRSTDGHSWSHMPLDPSTTYGTLHKIFDEAYVLANPEGDPDPWLDLQGLDSPLWGHHSLRRCADTVARATMA